MGYREEVERLEKKFGAEYEGTYVSKDRKHYITVLHKWGEFKYILYYDETGEWKEVDTYKMTEIKKQLEKEGFTYAEFF